MPVSLDFTGATLNAAIKGATYTYNATGNGSDAYDGGSANRRGVTTKHVTLAGPHVGYNLAAEHLVVTAFGSGGNVASNADFARTITIAKDNWLTTQERGEVNGELIYVYNGGPTTGEKSATNARVVGVTSKEGVGWAGQYEGDTRVVDASNVEIRKVNIQMGVLNTRDGDYYGHVLRADRGANISAYFAQDTSDGSFGSLIRAQSSTGRITYDVTMDGETKTRSDTSGNTDIKWKNESGALVFRNAAGAEVFRIGQTGYTGTAL